MKLFQLAAITSGISYSGSQQAHSRMFPIRMSSELVVASVARLKMEKDFQLPFALPMRIAKFSGIWSSSVGNRVYGLVLFFGLLVHTAVCMTVHLHRTLQSRNVEKLSDVLNIALTLYAVILKTISFVVKLEDIEELMKYLSKALAFSADDRNAVRLQLKTEAMRITKVSRTFYAFAMVAITISLLVPIMKFQSRTLAYNIWYPWDYKSNFIGFCLSAIYQYLVAVYACSVNHCLDIFPVIFMSFAKSLLKELSQRMTNTTKDDEKELVKCIEVHVRIKQLITRIEQNFSKMIMIQGLINSVILCTSAVLLTLVIMLLIDVHAFSIFSTDFSEN